MKKQTIQEKLAVISNTAMEFTISNGHQYKCAMSTFCDWFDSMGYIKEDLTFKRITHKEFERVCQMLIVHLKKDGITEQQWADKVREVKK